uniref:hypothetical protein n=1 Tax=Streptomyces calvus TaxID=67282 RepID=UPI003516A00A
MGGIDWGDAPTWVAGAFAAAAAFYARGTLRSQQKQIEEQRHFIEQQSMNLALEREALQAAADERKRAQASAVRMAVREVSSPNTPSDGAGGRVHWDALAADVVNESNEPVHDVVVRFGGQDAIGAKQGVRQRFAGGQLTGRWEGTGDELHPPVTLLGATGCLIFASGAIGREQLETERPVVFFTDNAGVRWSLDEHGSLQEVQ